MQSGPGVRFTLRLAHADADVVRYAVDIEQLDTNVRGELEVAVTDGTVRVDTEESVPDWVTDRIRAVMRAEWRARRSEASPWLRRITRWRPAP